MPSSHVNARLGSTSGAARLLVDGALVCIAYFAAGKLGLGLAFQNSSATPVWPPSGIALAAILARGYGLWPVIFLGAFLVNITTAGSTLACLGIAAGNTLEGVLGAHLVSRYAGGRQAFERVPDVFRFAGIAVASTTVAATIGSGCLLLDGLLTAGSLGSVWLTWWLGDAVGILVVAPPLLLWAVGARSGWSRARLAEGALLLLILVVASAAVFGAWSPWRTKNYPLEFVCLLPLLWAALRFQARGASAAILVLSAIAIRGTLSGFGPFVRLSPNESLLLLQAFLGAAAVTALSLGAAASERKRYETQLLYLVEHDPLTGVLTGKRFETELQHELALSLRYGTRGAVLFLDLDAFKAVNDRLGHRAGDELLTRLARLLKGRLRDSDRVARLGGDEFAILLPLADGPQAQAVGTQLAEAIAHEGAASVAGGPSVTASLGVALFPDHGLSVDELLSRADSAMYAAKQAGGNRCHSHPGDTASARSVLARIEGGAGRRKA